MTCALYITASQHNSRGSSSHEELPYTLRLLVKQVQRHTTSDGHSTSYIRSIHDEAVGERHVAEVTSPEQKRALRGRTAEEVVAGRFDRDFEVMLHCEGDACLC